MKEQDIGGGSEGLWDKTIWWVGVMVNGCDGGVGDSEWLKCCNGEGIWRGRMPEGGSNNRCIDEAQWYHGEW